jgi:hypothetical protein
MPQLPSGRHFALNDHLRSYLRSLLREVEKVKAAFVTEQDIRALIEERMTQHYAAGR